MSGRPSTRRRSRAWRLALLMPALVAPLLGSVGCSSPESLVGGIPLLPREALASGRFAVEAGVVYEIDLRCRITLPYNSEALELGRGVTSGELALEPAPSPFYTLGIRTEVRGSAVSHEDHTAWLELATLEPVRTLGRYEQMRDAGRKEAFEALRLQRGPQTTEMDLVQAQIREFYLSGTVAFEIPSGIKPQALDLERKVGGILMAFFISPELPGEGLSLTLAAPTTRDGFEIEASRGEACPRLVMSRDDYFRHAASRVPASPAEP